MLPGKANPRFITRLISTLSAVFQLPHFHRGQSRARGKAQKWQWLEAGEEGLLCEERWGLLQLINAQGCFDNPLPLCQITGAAAGLRDI